MTGVLAERFDRVLAVDVSAGMLDRAHEAVTASNVDFRLVEGDRLDTIEDGVADTLVCYLVLQHLPARDVVLRYLEEFARVLSPQGNAFVQLPVLAAGWQPRAWRVVRSAVVPVTSLVQRDVTGRAAYRGTRLTEDELQRGLAAAGLRTSARDESAESPYRYARELFLRLERAG
jgi:ubiquinone/menaquinone biosynthesis C-methylase UbiE